MPTFNQLSLLKKNSCKRLRKNHYNRTKHLKKCPQKKGVCVRVYITKPKKPNSAQRKVAKVALGRTFKSKKVLVSIPGQGHTLQKFSTVLVRGGRVRDIPGVRYRMIRGKEDFTMSEVFTRVHRRSFYGIKKPEAEYAMYKYQEAKYNDLPAQSIRYLPFNRDKALKLAKLRYAKFQKERW